MRNNDKKTVENKEYKPEGNDFRTLSERDHLILPALLWDKDPDLYNLLERSNGKIWIAGGSILSVLTHAPINDIDVFGCDDIELYRAASTYSQFCSGSKASFTQHTITMKGPLSPVQFITQKPYDSPLHCVSLFDFTVCQAGIWYQDNKWRSICSPHFYRDLKSKRLRYTVPNRHDEYPLNSLYRASKYMDRGYMPTKEDKVKLVDRFFKNYQRSNTGVYLDE